MTEETEALAGTESGPGPASKPEYLTITLTDHVPVRIEKADWPIIASAKDWDNQYECQANRTWKIIIRRHKDGRAVVYGIYNTSFQNEHDWRGGELLGPGEDVPAAIRRVGESGEFPDQCIREAIADLPAEDI